MNVKSNFSISSKFQIVEEMLENYSRKDNDHFTIKLSKYNATLLICTLAFTTRYMYYGRVAEIEIKDFF